MAQRLRSPAAKTGALLSCLGRGPNLARFDWDLAAPLAYIFLDWREAGNTTFRARPWGFCFALEAQGFFDGPRPPG